MSLLDYVGFEKEEPVGRELVETMVDIETLGCEPRAVVLSVGAVNFTQGRGVIDSFYALLPIQQQVNLGRTVDGATVEWWAQQDRRAFDAAFAPREKGADAGKVMKALGRFVRGEALPAATYEYTGTVWANPPSFDCVIIDTLCDDLGVGRPWSRRNLLCQRTAWRIAQWLGMTPEQWADVAANRAPLSYERIDHHPVHDCERQVEWLREARNFIAARAAVRKREE